MEKVIFFIDGFNLYHSLVNKRFNKYKWIDLSELAKNFITKVSFQTYTLPFLKIIFLLHIKLENLPTYNEYGNALQKEEITAFQKNNSQCFMHYST